MRTVLKGYCGPERFSLLQKIFDETWTELESRGNGAIEDAEAVRSKLATLIVEMMDVPDLDAELAKQGILQRLRERLEIPSLSET